MDADDISLPERLSKQVEYLDANPEVSFLATRLMLVDSENQITGIWPEDYYCVSRETIKQTLPVINCVGQPTIMMRREVAQAIGYNPKFKANEDWGMWLSALAKGHVIAKLPDVLLRYRQHGVNTTVVANESGVEGKIRRFKRLYLLDKMSTTGLQSTDKLVLKSYLKDILKSIVTLVSPRLQIFLGRLKLVRKKKLLQQFSRARTYFKNVDPELVFIFPFFHTGGAERVHADILESFSGSGKRVLTFVTGQSDNTAFFKRFEAHSSVLEISELLKLGITERWLFSKLSASCLRKDTCRFFGSNAKFLYDLVPHLPASVEISDLIHAFVHEYEDGPEKWSLPVVSRLAQRVVISNKTKKDLESLYQRNGISTEYASRIRVILNSIDIVEPKRHKKDELFKVAYVGRAGEEKRVELIAEIANELSVTDSNIRFHFVGNIEPFLPKPLRGAIHFHGEITDQGTLDRLYDEFDILVIASTREGFPMVIMEAMMHAVVPLSTDVGGIPEHISDGENGLLVANSNDAAVKENLKQKIKYLYLNRAEWQRLSDNARTYAVQNFGRQTFGKAYRNLLLDGK
ncbi:MAG: glycosyltransferase [Bacteroidia bacterium]|nr:glycosyltransferase [Bacteroidia bacterium]